MSTVGSKSLFESQMAGGWGGGAVLTLGSFCLDGNPTLDKNSYLLGAASPCFGQIATWFLAPGTLPLPVSPQICLSLCLHLPLPCISALQPCSSLPSHAAPRVWLVSNVPFCGNHTSHACAFALPSGTIVPQLVTSNRGGSCGRAKARPALWPAPAAHPVSTAYVSQSGPSLASVASAGL